MTQKGCSKDAEWLTMKMLNFFENFPKRDKKRFSVMRAEAFAHALMMCYGAYLMNYSETGNSTIIPINKGSVTK